MLQNNRAIQNNDGPPAHNLRSGSVRTIHGDHNAVTMDAAAVRELTNALQAMSVPQDIEKYSGKDTTDVHKWFRDYEVMSMSKHWGDEEHLRWFPNFLTGKARIWLYGLPEETKVSWPVLRAAFLRSFALSSSAKWAREQALRSTQQRAGQTLTDFISTLREEADAIGLNEDARVDIAWHNMLPANNNFIIAKPATLQAFLNTPLGRGEVSPPETTATQSEDIQALRNEVRGLTSQMSALVASMGAAVATGGPRNMGQPGRNTNQLPHRNGPRHRDNNTFQANYQQPGMMGHQSDGKTRYQQGHRDRPHYTPRRGYQCGRCGGACTNRGQCPAVNQRCHRCNTLDHFADMCRTVPNQA